VLALYFKLILGVLLILCSICAPYHVQAAHKIMGKLQVEKSIETIEQFLNSVKTFQASFKQYDQDGNVRKGEFFLSRPNKMCFYYHTPQEEKIILNDDFIVYFNYELKETNYLSADAFPISFLGDEKIDIRKNARILNVIELTNLLSIELEILSGNQPRRIILEFTKSPLNFSTFYLQDEVGSTVRMVFFKTITNQPIDDDSFSIK